MSKQNKRKPTVDFSKYDKSIKVEFNYGLVKHTLCKGVYSSGPVRIGKWA
jgi:hypothetical protein